MSLLPDLQSHLGTGERRDLLRFESEVEMGICSVGLCAVSFISCRSFIVSVSMK